MALKLTLAAAAIALSGLSRCQSLVVDFEADAGAIADLDDLNTSWHNGRLLNESLAALESGDTLLVPNKTFTLMGGIYASGLDSVTIRIDGVLSFAGSAQALLQWPRSGPGVGPKGGKVLQCMQFDDMKNVTITSAR